MSPLLRPSRRAFLKTLGAATLAFPFVTSNLLANPPSRRVRHASFGAGGMAWADLTQIANAPNVDIVAVCDVDLTHLADAKKQFPNARFYQDWRELLDKEAGQIDSVNVSTPDHMHAPIGVSAMQLGKHVYGQKPLAHDLHEVRRMTQLAALCQNTSLSPTRARALKIGHAWILGPSTARRAGRNVSANTTASAAAARSMVL